MLPPGIVTVVVAVLLTDVMFVCKELQVMGAFRLGVSCTV